MHYEVMLADFQMELTCCFSQLVNSSSESWYDKIWQDFLRDQYLSISILSMIVHITNWDVAGRDSWNSCHYIGEFTGNV